MLELPDLDGLLARQEDLARFLTRAVRQGRRIAVVTHIDADGLTSGSIAFSALARRGANVLVRSIPDLDQRAIMALAEEKHDFYIFTDLGSTLVNELSSALGSNFLVIDHHQLPEADVGNPLVVNAWQFGYDGGREASSSTMAYLLAVALDDQNKDLAPLAVVGAVADRQDAGPGRSLGGLNRRALEDAQSAGLLMVSKDLLFHGRETRPVHEAIALTSSPFIQGLSGSKDATLAALVKGGIALKANGRWRALSELSNDEKKKLLEVLLSFLPPTSSAENTVAELIGEVYTLELEDSFTPLRDAREFATMLNACGRMDAAGVGISICIGDRGDSLKEGTRTLSEYRLKINKFMQGILQDPARIQVIGGAALVIGDDLVDERLLGPVASILASTQRLKDKVVVARTRSGDAELKFSSRVGDSHLGRVNLGIIMREAAEAAGGVGGGHTMAAGAKIPYTKGEEFTKVVLERAAS